MAEFDFSSLTPTTTELPTTGGRQRKVQDNPFVKWLQESHSEKAGKAVTVPNEHVKRTVYLIRQAGEDLSLGVRVAYSLDKEARDKAPKDKPVKVMFQAKEKRPYQPRPRKAESTPDTPSPATVPDTPPATQTPTTQDTKAGKTTGKAPAK